MGNGVARFFSLTWNNKRVLQGTLIIKYIELYHSNSQEQAFIEETLSEHEEITDILTTRHNVRNHSYSSHLSNPFTRLCLLWFPCGLRGKVFRVQSTQWGHALLMMVTTLLYFLTFCASSRHNS